MLETMTKMMAARQKPDRRMKASHYAKTKEIKQDR
jgi:hypothetical protein